MENKKKGHLLIWVFVILAIAPVAYFALHILSEDQEGPRDPSGLGGSIGARQGLKIIKDASPHESQSSVPDDAKIVTYKKPKLSHLYQGLQGQVLDAITLEPISKYTLHYCTVKEGSIKDNLGLHQQALRRGDGVFRVLGLEEGEYNLAIDAFGYPLFVEKNLKVPQEEDLLVFQLPRGNHIHGVVTTNANQPIYGLSVNLIVEELDNPNDPAPARRIARTDNKGGFLFGGLPSGRYSLCVKQIQYSLAEVKDLYVGSGCGVYQKMMMPPLSTVEVKVMDRNGAKLPNAMVRLYSSQKNDFLISFPAMKTNLYGKAVISLVPSGNYNVRVSKSSFHTGDQTINIYAGQEKVEVSQILERIQR